jgi:acyl-CoA synthetase (NDP forming)
MAGKLVEDGVRLFEQNNVHNFETGERAARALAGLIRYGKRKR